MDKEKRTAGTHRVAYEIDRCPKCGAELGGPDDNLDRHCHACGITVLGAWVTFEYL